MKVCINHEKNSMNDYINNINIPDFSNNSIYICKFCGVLIGENNKVKFYYLKSIMKINKNFRIFQ